MATEDDDLERRLRDVLHSRGLGVPVPPDAIDRIHAGARRRQQRRAAVAALGAVVVIGVVAGAIGLNVGGGHGSNVAANLSSSSPSTSAAQTATPLPLIIPVTESPGVASSPPVAGSSPAAAASPPVASVFNPVSVSAIGVNDYWVLGYMSTKTSDGFGISTAIMQTTDGGQHFQADATPAAFVGQAPTSLPPDAPTISEIRFGDTNDGWLFGAKLFATTDGGASWSAVTGIPGDVVDLAAASGNVWAVSNTVNTSSYSLYHATYGSSGTGTWTKVPLGTSLIGQPGLAVVKQDAFLLAQVGSGQGETFVIAGDGKSLASRAAPCASSGNTVSVAGDGALWIRCDGNPDSLIFVSNNQAVHWQQATVATGAATVGGVDATHAVIETTDGMHVISVAGDSTSVAYAPGADQSLPGFIGFTTTKIGFIVTDGNGAQLWRTTDGGASWSVVAF